MILRAITALTISTLLAQSAQAASFNFCWAGNGGYALTGKIAFPDSKMNRPFITQDDVTAFKITGYRDGVQIGSWNMDDATPDTTWHLRFLPYELTFPTGDAFDAFKSQGWNANGSVNDCGAGGFGFNSGSYAQDVCVDGVYMRDSSIPPDTPLVATTAPVTPDCRQTTPMSKR